MAILSHKARATLQYSIPAALAYILISSVAFSHGSNFGIDAVKASGGLSILTLVVMLIIDTIPKPAKEVIVFWRLTDRLPGHRAFSERFVDRARHNLEKIKNIGQLRQLDGKDQQRVFYSLYLKHQSDPRITSYSIKYIAWRDVAGLYLTLSILTTPVAMIIGDADSLRPASIISVILVVLSSIVATAARHAATELVHFVLTKEAAGRSHVVAI